MVVNNKGMSKFKEFFSEPRHFEESGWVISREHFSEEEAIKIFEKDTGDKFEKIEEDTVKFCMCGGNSDIYDEGTPYPMWYLGLIGRNSKKVWVINYL